MTEKMVVLPKLTIFCSLGLAFKRVQWIILILYYSLMVHILIQIPKNLMENLRLSILLFHQYLSLKMIPSLMSLVPSKLS